MTSIQESKFGVSGQKMAWLSEKFLTLGIQESDLIEKFIKSSGPGGQNVNKLSTAVYLKHKTSGLEVKCQKARSQALNRFFARCLLIQKLEAKLMREKSEEQVKIEKLRRQKKRRSRKAKAKILADKKKLSEKKNWRKKPNDNIHEE